MKVFGVRAVYWTGIDRREKILAEAVPCRATGSELEKTGDVTVMTTMEKRRTTMMAMPAATATMKKTETPQPQPDQWGPVAWSPRQ